MAQLRVAVPQETEPSSNWFINTLCVRFNSLVLSDTALLGLGSRSLACRNPRATRDQAVIERGLSRSAEAGASIRLVGKKMNLETSGSVFMRRRFMTRKSSAVVKSVLLVTALAVGLSSMAMAGTETVVHAFLGQTDTGFPNSGLVADSAGNLYGLTYENGGAVFELTPDGNGGWNYNVIYGFTGFSDGFYPVDPAGVAIDSQGNLYGTCGNGGDYNNGAVWELSKGSDGVWRVARTYGFTGSGSDGSEPEASVLLDSAGNVYGTTSGGGSSGAGTVFKLTPSGNGWTEQTLHSFTFGSDGARPRSSLIMDRAGNLYGTTLLGGASGNGVVFKLHPVGGSWVENVLYAFTGNPDGSDGFAPLGNLTFDSAGRIYGATQADTSGYGGYGGVFRLTPSPNAPRTVEQPWRITWLHHFNGSDGWEPSYGVTLDSHGNVYGSTQYGGQNLQACNAGCGVVFELTPSGQSWTENVLYGFTGGSDGGNPLGNVFVDNAGNVYGTTMNGGAYLYGTIYKVTP